MRPLTTSECHNVGHGPFWVLEENSEGIVRNFCSEYKFFMQHMRKTPYQAAINCFVHWVMDHHHASEMIAHIDCDETGMLTNLVHFSLK